VINWNTKRFMDSLFADIANRMPASSLVPLEEFRSGCKDFRIFIKFLNFQYLNVVMIFQNLAIFSLEPDGRQMREHILKTIISIRIFFLQ
jgi:hypothetical protein